MAHAAPPHHSAVATHSHTSSNATSLPSPASIQPPPALPTLHIPSIDDDIRVLPAFTPPAAHITPYQHVEIQPPPLEHTHNDHALIVSTLDTSTLSSHPATTSHDVAPTTVMTEAEQHVIGSEQPTHQLAEVIEALWSLYQKSKDNTINKVEYVKMYVRMAKVLYHVVEYNEAYMSALTDWQRDTQHTNGESLDLQAFTRSILEISKQWTRNGDWAKQFSFLQHLYINLAPPPKTTQHERQHSKTSEDPHMSAIEKLALLWRSQEKLKINTISDTEMNTRIRTTRRRMKRLDADSRVLMTPRVYPHTTDSDVTPSSLVLSGTSTALTLYQPWQPSWSPRALQHITRHSSLSTSRKKNQVNLDKFKQWLPEDGPRTLAHTHDEKNKYQAEEKQTATDRISSKSSTPSNINKSSLIRPSSAHPALSNAARSSTFTFNVASPRPQTARSSLLHSPTALAAAAEATPLSPSAAAVPGTAPTPHHVVPASVLTVHPHPAHTTSTVEGELAAQKSDKITDNRNRLWGANTNRMKHIAAHKYHIRSLTSSKPFISTAFSLEHDDVLERARYGPMIALPSSTTTFTEHSPQSPSTFVSLSMPHRSHMQGYYDDENEMKEIAGHIKFQEFKKGIVRKEEKKSTASDEENSLPPRPKSAKQRAQSARRSARSSTGVSSTASAASSPLPLSPLASETLYYLNSMSRPQSAVRVTRRPATAMTRPHSSRARTLSPDTSTAQRPASAVPRITSNALMADGQAIKNTADKDETFLTSVGDEEKEPPHTAPNQMITVIPHLPISPPPLPPPSTVSSSAPSTLITQYVTILSKPPPVVSCDWFHRLMTPLSQPLTHSLLPTRDEQRELEIIAANSARRTIFNYRKAEPEWLHEQPHESDSKQRDSPPRPAQSSIHHAANKKPVPQLAFDQLPASTILTTVAPPSFRSFRRNVGGLSVSAARSSSVSVPLSPRQAPAYAPVANQSTTVTLTPVTSDSTVNLMSNFFFTSAAPQTLRDANNAKPKSSSRPTTARTRAATKPVNTSAAPHVPKRPSTARPSTARANKSNQQPIVSGPLPKNAHHVYHTQAKHQPPVVLPTTPINIQFDAPIAYVPVPSVQTPRMPPPASTPTTTRRISVGKPVYVSVEPPLSTTSITHIHYPTPARSPPSEIDVTLQQQSSVNNAISPTRMAIAAHIENFIPPSSLYTSSIPSAIPSVSIGPYAGISSSTTAHASYSPHMQVSVTRRASVKSKKSSVKKQPAARHDATQSSTQVSPSHPSLNTGLSISTQSLSNVVSPISTHSSPPLSHAHSSQPTGLTPPVSYHSAKPPPVTRQMTLDNLIEQEMRAMQMSPSVISTARRAHAPFVPPVQVIPEAAAVVEAPPTSKSSDSDSTPNSSLNTPAHAVHDPNAPPHVVHDHVLRQAFPNMCFSPVNRVQQ